MILDFLSMSGPFVFPLLFLLLLILGLAVRSLAALRRAEPARRAHLRTEIDGILFWGAFAAVLGVLGQGVGLYRSFRTLAQRGLSPVCAEAPERCFAIGFSESLTTSITGLSILLLAGCFWAALRGKAARPV